MPEHLAAFRHFQSLELNPPLQEDDDTRLPQGTQYLLLDCEGLYTSTRDNCFISSINIDFYSCDGKSLMLGYFVWQEGL